MTPLGSHLNGNSWIDETARQIKCFQIVRQTETASGRKDEMVSFLTLSGPVADSDYQENNQSSDASQTEIISHMIPSQLIAC